MEAAWESVVPFEESKNAEAPAGEAALLNGPALAGEDRVSQDDIDSLFN